MYGQKQIIYPDGRKNNRADILDIAVHFVTFFAVLILMELVFEEIASPIGFGICFVYLAFLGFTAFYIYSKQKNFPLKALLPLSLCVISALSIGYHNYTFSFIIPYLFYLSGLFCMALTSTKGAFAESYTDLYLQLKAMFFYPISKLFAPAVSVVKSLSFIGNKKYLGALIGSVCGIPVLIVVALLLAESDAAFSSVMSGLAKFLENIFSDDDSLTFLFVVPSLVFSSYIVSTVFAFRHGTVKEKINSGNDEERAEVFRFIPSSALCGFYGVVALVYVIYLFSQLGYLFGAFTGKLPDGGNFTRVSDYARQGFFEMSAVAFINLCLIAFGAFCSKRDRNNNISKYFKGFSVFFCLFTMLLIITAMSKMFLYISDFGLTEKRIIVTLADVVFFVAFLSVLIRLFCQSFPYMKIIMSLALVLTTAYFAVSPMYVITTYNTNAYLSGKHKEIDIDSVGGYLGAQYYSMINLDKVAQSESVHYLSAQAEVYRIYTSEKEYCVGVNSVEDYLLHKYIKENEERIKGYKKAYDNEYHNLYYYPAFYADFTEDVFFISIDSDKKLKSIVVTNELNELVYEEDYEVAKGTELDVYLEYPNEAAVLATITLTDEEGNKYTCELKKDENNPSRYFSLKDTADGGVICEQLEF